MSPRSGPIEVVKIEKKPCLLTSIFMSEFARNIEQMKSPSDFKEFSKLKVTQICLN